jgi:hypothetical protein
MSSLSTKPNVVPKRKRALSVCKKLKAKLRAVSGDIFEYMPESWQLLKFLSGKTQRALNLLNACGEDEKEKMLDLARSEDVQQLVLLNIHLLEQDATVFCTMDSATKDRLNSYMADNAGDFDRLMTTYEKITAALVGISAVDALADTATLTTVGDAETVSIETKHAPAVVTTALDAKDIDEGDLVINFESEADIKTKRDILSSNTVVNYLALSWATGRYLAVVTKIHSEAEDHAKNKDDAFNEQRLNDGSTDAWEDAAAAVDAFMNGEDDVDETLCILLDELEIMDIDKIK